LLRPASLVPRPVKGRYHAIFAQRHFIGDGELSGGDAELRSAFNGAEDEVAFGVANFKSAGQVGSRFQIGFGQAQSADVDGLARLVNWLVGRQQNLRCLFHRDRLVNAVIADGRLDEN
jgi:hypothetical protein